jgi:hypothetical protein
MPRLLVHRRAPTPAFLAVSTNRLAWMTGLSDPRKWADRYYRGATTFMDYVERRPPLVVLAGDVGTGKTEAQVRRAFATLEATTW